MSEPSIHDSAYSPPAVEAAKAASEKLWQGIRNPGTKGMWVPRDYAALLHQAATTERHRTQVAEGERDEAREALTDLLDVIDEQKIEGTCVTGTCHWPAVTREAWLGREALERDQAHRACPYCNYHRDHCAAEWNALTQEARTALVAARLCDG